MDAMALAWLFGAGIVRICDLGGLQVDQQCS